MKKITFLLAATGLMLTVSSGFSQGQIAFVNSGTTLVTLNGAAAPLTSSSGIKIELFYQADPTGSTAPAQFTSLANLGNWLEITTPQASISPLAGRFNGGTAITGNSVAPDANVYLEAVGFNGNATSYANALGGASTAFGYSSVWSQGTGDGASIAPISIAANGFSGLAIVVPEPSTIVLGGLGAAALLAFRRRK